jgi:predicted nucleic acid-binding protein
VRLYLDANAIIYSIEGKPQLRSLTLSWIRRALDGPRGEIVTSRLSLLETRSRPLRDGDQATLALYDNFFRRTTLLEVTAEIIDRATELRARFNLRSPDAVHTATAIHAHADSFLTGDKRLARVSSLAVVVVKPA